MDAIIGKRGSQSGSKRPRTVAAVFMIVSVGLGLWFAMEHLKGWLHLHHNFRLIMPLTAVLCIASVLPLVMFLTFQDEFGSINPLIPSHYFYLCRRTYRAIQENNFKVGGKDF